MNPRPPQLERLLLDADLNPLVEGFLNALGFRTVWATTVDVDIEDDVAILKYARRRRMILVCHDNHNDRATRIRLIPELYRNGGRIIQIHGDSSQDPMTAAAKLAVHREEWLDFFGKQSGRVVVSAGRMTRQSAARLYTRVQHALKLAVSPREAVRGRERPEVTVRRRRSPRAGRAPMEKML